jgi:hypothetical protein
MNAFSSNSGQGGNADSAASGTPPTVGTAPAANVVPLSVIPKCQPWVDWIAERVGTHKWVVAHRMTPRLAKQYELAISHARYRELTQEWNALEDANFAARHPIAARG